MKTTNEFMVHMANTVAYQTIKEKLDSCMHALDLLDKSNRLFDDDCSDKIVNFYNKLNLRRLRLMKTKNKLEKAIIDFELSEALSND